MLELIALFVFCVLVGLACLGVIVWTLLSGGGVGVEFIFLVHVSLLLTGLFFGLAFWIATRSPLRALWRAKSSEGTAQAELSPPQQSPEVQDKVSKPAS